MSKKNNNIRKELRLSPDAIQQIQAIRKERSFPTDNATVDFILRDYKKQMEGKDTYWKLLQEEIKNTEPLQEEIILLKAKIKAFCSAFDNLNNLNQPE